MSVVINNNVLTDASVVIVPQTMSPTPSRYILQTTDAVGSSRQINFGYSGVDGETASIEIVQSATGSRLITFGSKVAFGTDIASYVATTTANKRDFVRFQFNKSLDKWLVVDIKKGF